MLLTAQHVQSDLSHKEGINVFLYNHGAMLSGEINWSQPTLDDLAAVSEAAPGNLAADDVEVAPGNNRVRSFLDVLCQDDTSPARIAATLRALSEAEAREAPTELVTDRIAARFEFVGRPLVKLGEKGRELEALARRALNLLSNPTPSAWRQREPLVAEVRRDDAGAIYALSDESAKRVRTEIGDHWRRPRIHIAQNVADDFSYFHGPILLEQLVPVVSGLDRDGLFSLGGIRFVDQSGTTLYEWPPRRQEP
jgi:hypothetical protein